MVSSPRSQFLRPALRRAIPALFGLALTACATIDTPQHISSSRASNGSASARAGKVASNGSRIVSNAEMIQRIRAIRAEKAREKAEQPTVFGVKIPNLSAISFSHIARGLQPADVALDPPPVPLPDFASPAEQPSPIEQILAQAPDGILDERAAKLLEEAERMDSTILDESIPLSELARGSLSPEAFQKISTEIQTAKSSKRAVFLAVLTCVLALCICGFFVFRHILEELRLRQLPSFGRTFGE